MSFKILDAFGFLKKQEVLTKKTQADLEGVISTIVNDQVTNPVDAYVLLDFLKKVVTSSQEKIKEKVADYIEGTGECQGYGVTLSLQERSSFNYEKDPKWKEIFDSEEIVTARRKRREQELKKLAQENEQNKVENDVVVIEHSQVIVAKYES